MRLFRSISSGKAVGSFGKTIGTTCLLMALAAPASYAQGSPSKGNTVQNSRPVVASGPQRNIAWKGPTRQRAVSRPANIVLRPGVAAPRYRTVNNRVVYRRYGPTIYGYGFYSSDAEAAKWLAFTHISLALIDGLQEQQVRYYEQAQIDATSAPIGETIVWNDGGASGTTTALREGADVNGNICREFQQTITVNGNYESANGTACLQNDGTWDIIS